MVILFWKKHLIYGIYSRTRCGRSMQYASQGQMRTMRALPRNLKGKKILRQRDKNKCYSAHHFIEQWLLWWSNVSAMYVISDLQMKCCLMPFLFPMVSQLHTTACTCWLVCFLARGLRHEFLFSNFGCHQLANVGSSYYFKQIASSGTPIWRNESCNHYFYICK